MKFSRILIYTLANLTILTCNAWKAENYKDACTQCILLSGSDLCRADLKKINLNKARLLGSYLCRSNFRRASLEEADLTMAHMQRSNFKYANLKKANLTKAEMQNIKLKGANLEGANLSNADLSNANLTNAILCGANLKDIKLDETIVLNADFKNCTGLTNEQKKYLRKHGALNVPVNEKQKIIPIESKRRGIAERICAFLSR